MAGMDGWKNAKPGQLLGYDADGNEACIDAGPQAFDVFLARQQVMYAALLAAQDALETLRRGHGVEVGSLCYPALNLVRDAVALCRRLGRDA